MTPNDDEAALAELRRSYDAAGRRRADRARAAAEAIRRAGGYRWVVRCARALAPLWEAEERPGGDGAAPADDVAGPAAR